MLEVTKIRNIQLDLSRVIELNSVTGREIQ